MIIFALGWVTGIVTAGILIWFALGSDVSED